MPAGRPRTSLRERRRVTDDVRDNRRPECICAAMGEESRAVCHHQMRQQLGRENKSDLTTTTTADRMTRERSSAPFQSVKAMKCKMQRWRSISRLCWTTLTRSRILQLKFLTEKECCVSQTILRRASGRGREGRFADCVCFASSGKFPRHSY